MTDTKTKTHKTYTEQTEEKPNQNFINDLVYDSKFECPECKGFYCNYCKSNIPPIYRPVPDEKGTYHFHPNKQSIELYKKVYGTNACLNCSSKY